mmetsp:Transcript_22946/g.38781  ORF Transcript_22946/g.38781 Transcript_22946/m.38781 type:complete len:264 (+) Transcript_22946:142-933(+)
MASMFGINSKKQKAKKQDSKLEERRERKRIEIEKSSAEFAELKRQREAREKTERDAREKVERRLAREEQLRSRELARKEEYRIKSEAMRSALKALDKITSFEGMVKPTGHISAYRTQRALWDQMPKESPLSTPQGRASLRCASTGVVLTTGEKVEEVEERAQGRKARENRNSIYPGRGSMCLTPRCASPETTIQLSGYCVDCGFRRLREGPTSKGRGKSRFAGDVSSYLDRGSAVTGGEAAASNHLGEYDDPEFEEWLTSQSR